MSHKYYFNTQEYKIVAIFSEVKIKCGNIQKTNVENGW